MLGEGYTLSKCYGAGGGAAWLPEGAGVAGSLMYLPTAWTTLGAGCLRSPSVRLTDDISHVTSMSGSRGKW